MTIFYVSLEMKERFAIGRKLDKFSLLSEGFFNSGLIIEHCKVEGKVPVVMERFPIERIVGDIALAIIFSMVVGTGSKSQYESDDEESRLSISSKVAGVKEWSREGGEGGRE